MDIHNIAPPEWVAARKALVHELTWLRNQYDFGVSNGREMFAGSFLECNRDVLNWTGRFDRVEAYLTS